MSVPLSNGPPRLLCRLPTRFCATRRRSLRLLRSIGQEAAGPAEHRSAAGAGRAMRNVRGVDPRAAMHEPEVGMLWVQTEEEVGDE